MHVLYGHAPWPRADAQLPTKPDCSTCYWQKWRNELTTRQHDQLKIEPPARCQAGRYRLLISWSFQSSLCSTELIREGRDGAAVASSSEDPVRFIKDKSVVMIDRRALSTLTGLLISTTNVEDKIPSSSRQAELGFNQVCPALAKFRGESTGANISRIPI